MRFDVVSLMGGEASRPMDGGYQRSSEGREPELHLAPPLPREVSTSVLAKSLGLVAALNARRPTKQLTALVTVLVTSLGSVTQWSSFTANQTKDAAGT